MDVLCRSSLPSWCEGVGVVLSLTAQPSDFDGDATLLQFTAGSSVLGASLLSPARAVLSAFFFPCCVFWRLLPFPSLFSSILSAIFAARVEDEAGRRALELMPLQTAGAGPSCCCWGIVILPGHPIPPGEKAPSRLAGSTVLGWCCSRPLRQLWSAVAWALISGDLLSFTPAKPVSQACEEGKVALSLPCSVFCWPLPFLLVFPSTPAVRETHSLFAFRVFLPPRCLVKGACRKSRTCSVQIKSRKFTGVKIAFLGWGTCSWGLEGHEGLGWRSRNPRLLRRICMRCEA